MTKTIKFAMRHILTLMFALVCCLQISAADDFDTFMKRIRKDSRRNPNVEKWLKLYDAEKGSFSDIDYSRNYITNWPPQNHLERLEDWAAAYVNEKNKHFEDEALADNIIKALQFWQDTNPNCKNWWFNQIAEPQALGIILIQMRAGKKQVPQELEAAILKRMLTDGGDPAKWTGANRTDICLHWIYRSCLERNEKDMQKAMQLVFDPIRYTTKEGFQHDGSYFQHGTQLYIGGYGDEILKGVTQVAMYAIGTRYALDNDKVQLLSHFMRETYYPSIRGKYMLYDVMGRSMSRVNMLNKSSKALFARRMIKLDPTHADEFKQIVERLTGKQPASYAVKPTHNHYFRADYTMHVRKGYTFDVRMVSNRTSRLEYGNKENLKTYFVSDGCNALVKNGDEYFNIFPAWNWTRIPGTTAPQMPEVPLAQHDWQQEGTSQFAGGVTDSIYGATAYAYDDTWAGINTKAKKAWFFFDNEIVCLGSGITSTNDNTVLTTLNQRLAQKTDAVLYAEGNKVVTAKDGDHIKASNINWVSHDGTGYVFPNGGNVMLDFDTQKGNWKDINRSMPNREETYQVLALSLDHGIKPADASYAYIVVPEAGDAKSLDAYCKKQHVNILSNTTDIQAVEQTDLGIWQAVFHKPTTLNARNITLTVDKPCIVMVRRHNNGNVTLHVADPAQKQEHINVEIKLKGSLKKAVKQMCDFTGTGIYAGQTKVYKLK